MISPAQNALYWRLWSQAKRVLMKGRETWTGDEENKRRHEVHVRAIGRNCSHYDLRNWEFTQVIKELRTIINPAGAIDHNRRAHEAERRRMYFGLRGAMRRLRMDESYVNAISRKMFLGLEIGDLSTDEIHKLLKALRIHEDRKVA